MIGNVQTIQAIYKKTREMRTSLCAIDYSGSEVIDPQVFDFDVSKQEMIDTCELLKKDLTELTNLVNSIII